MPRRPKFIHPLRVVRIALNKSQPQFAKMFGVSASYIQAVELAERTLNDELADAIMLRFGVDAESLKVDVKSLKRKRGAAPVHLIDANKAEFMLWSGPSENRADFAKAIADYNALKKTRDQQERFRRSVLFWQKRIVPAWRSEDWEVHDALDNKLRLLFEAARRENKYHSVAMRLSCWIDNTVSEFRLRTTIDVIRNSRTGRDAQWPAFMDTLSPSFRLKPRSRRRRKR